MLEKGRPLGLDCVLIDLNTQNDFCADAGAAPVVNRDRVLSAVKRIIGWARSYQVPIVSSVDSHRENDLSLLAGHYHCIEGSDGQHKLDFTVFPSHVMVENDNTIACPLDLLHRHQQVIFTQRADDLLSNPKADRFLTQLQAREFIVFGNGIENAVKSVVLGLRAREKNVTLICEACGFWDDAAADFALRQISAKGAVFATVEELLARRPLVLHRYRRRLVPSRNGVHAGVNGSASDHPERNGRNGHRNGNGSGRGGGLLRAPVNGDTLGPTNGRLSARRREQG